MKIYIVWNKEKTEGYATPHKGIAYEVRKGAESNCFTIDGERMKAAQAFCEVYSCHEDCTMEELNK